MMVRVLPGGLNASSTVRSFIQNAYKLQGFQVVGGPAWIDSDRFQVEAKAGGSASREDVLLMLQSLLEERFQLKTHQETRELPVYALAASKGGPKLPAPEEGACAATAGGAPPPPPSPGQPLTPPCGNIMVAIGAPPPGAASAGPLPAGVEMRGRRVGMADLARTLSMVLGRPVVDKTGVTGQFDVQMTFTPDPSTAGLPRPPGGASSDAATSTDQPTTSIFSALQEQLGLKLESAKGPVEVLVIDHVERPSEN